MLPKTPAGQLKIRLQKLLNKGIMLGHQDDPVYGTTWKWDEGKSDVLLTTGDYPAVMGFDLGKIELDSKENLDGVLFDRMRQEIIAQYKRGGIVTLSWHPWNPATGENACGSEREMLWLPSWMEVHSSRNLTAGSKKYQTSSFLSRLMTANSFL